jgi:hypothetical protein
MKVSELTRLLNNRMTYLDQQKTQAEFRGDVAEVLWVTAQIDETRVTLDALKAAQQST